MKEIIFCFILFVSTSAFSAQWNYAGKSTQVETNPIIIEELTIKYPEVLTDLGFATAQFDLDTFLEFR